MKVCICSSSGAPDASTSVITTIEGRALQNSYLEAKQIQEKSHLTTKCCQVKTFAKKVSIKERLHDTYLWGVRTITLLVYRHYIERLKKNFKVLVLECQSTSINQAVSWPYHTSSVCILLSVLVADESA